MNPTIRRICKLTKQDLKRKTLIQLHASTIEEIGELSRELKIQEKLFGNTYKVKDEGVAGEAIDVLICALSLAFAVNSKILENVEFRQFKTKQSSFELLNQLNFESGLLSQSLLYISVNPRSIAPECILNATDELEPVLTNMINVSMELIFHDSEIDFLKKFDIEEAINVKLDKWEKSSKD